MNGTELKQLRRLLFIDISEAAKLIGECEPRTWQRWEKGDRSVPLDVAETIQMLSLTRMEKLQYEYDENNPNYRYFETFDEYKACGGGGNELMWRMAQSLAAQLLCDQQASLWRMQETIDK
jgi:hypothetical protein